MYKFLCVETTIYVLCAYVHACVYVLAKHKPFCVRTCKDLMNNSFGV